MILYRRCTDYGLSRSVVSLRIHDWPEIVNVMNVLDITVIHDLTCAHTQKRAMQVSHACPSDVITIVTRRISQSLLITS